VEKNIDDREVSDRVGSGVDKLYSPSATRPKDGSSGRKERRTKRTYLERLDWITQDCGAYSSR
jgi:hypothetical protein